MYYMEKINLITLKNKIESLEKTHHAKILQVLLKNKVKFSENRNGVFINMNALNKKTLDEIKTTLSYIAEQEKTINDIEKLKNNLNQNYFKNNNKEKTNSNINNEKSFATI